MNILIAHDLRAFLGALQSLVESVEGNRVVGIGCEPEDVLPAAGPTAGDLLLIGAGTFQNDFFVVRGAPECTSCTPDCVDKECGGDGCGGPCGFCSSPQDECIDGQCLCQPECVGKECGPDGCGGSCGECGCGETCIDTACSFNACEDKECGSDGCSGSCGNCSQGYHCSNGNCKLDWISISAGAHYSCGVDVSLDAWCWGHNYVGKLGNGTTDNSIYPVQPLGLGETSVLVADESHSCAIVGPSGTAWCWGKNYDGKLGSGTEEDSLFPVQVVGLSGVVEIAPAQNHTCALKDDDTVWCWGWNGQGQLGTGISGADEGSTTPVQVVGLTNVLSISAGTYHSCAVKNDGTVWCWGWNVHGALGIGTLSSYYEPSPVQVVGLTGAISVAVSSYHYSCSVKGNGTVWCWGDNSHGQLGDGTKDDSHTPVQVVELNNIIQIDTARLHACAVRGDGTVWCWGYGDHGRLGNGSTSTSLVPAQVIGQAGASTVSATHQHTCAKNNDGTVWCWGSNSWGELGDGNQTFSAVTSPVQVLDLPL